MRKYRGGGIATLCLKQVSVLSEGLASDINDDKFCLSEAENTLKRIQKELTLARKQIREMNFEGK